MCNTAIWWSILYYLEDGVEPLDGDLKGAIRLVVIIPSEAYELNTETAGTETDMWRIEAK